MLRNRKSSCGPCRVFILTLFSAISIGLAIASDEVPDGFKADRYQKVWERNPFTIVTPVAVIAQPKMFDKFILVSWMNDGDKDVVFVQNTETNEVQKVTKDPNSNSFRLIAIHKAADPKNAEVVLSNGVEEGSVKFRLEAAVPAPQQQEGGQPTAGVQNPVPGVQGSVPGVQAPPAAGMSRQAQMAQNAQQALQQAARNQPGAVQMQPQAVVTPPRAAEVRRKRITAPPVTEQPVNVPTPVLPNMPVQPQTQ